MKLLYYTVLLFSCALQFSSCNADSVNATGGDEKIVGGEVAIKNEFPWLVHLLIDERSICGGAILNNNYILTAAHCLDGKSSALVTAGDHDRTDEDGEQRIQSCKLIVHPNYSPNTLQNDIALIKLSQPLVPNSKISKIDLPPANFLATGTVTVAGWGVQADGSTTVSRYLQKVNVSIVSNEACQTQYDAAQQGITITNNMICAQSPGKDSCQGDSGGPLLCRSGNERYACGIVSFGIGCARPQYPGVYTKVSSYLPWIQQQIADVEKCNSNANTINNSLVFMFTSILTYLLVK